MTWAASRLRRLLRAMGRSDAGMTLSELIITIAISSVVLVMVASVSASMLRSNAKNLAREVATGGVRDASAWLGEALSFASSEMSDGSQSTSLKPAILTAQPNELRFTSAMPADGDSAQGALTEVTLKLGKACWTGKDDPGALHRCLRYPQSFDKTTKKAVFCEYGVAGCASDLFKDKVVARDVKTDPKAPIFAYYVLNGAAADPATAPLKQVSSLSAGFADVRAVEFRVTVVGRSDGGPVEATVYKYFAIDEWSRI
jgi:prepilin-type N-terminal cleavage/methylation domain-containing protein